MFFTLSDIRTQLGEAAYSRGQEYAQAGRVLTQQRRGEGIEATVRGSAQHIYAQAISISNSGPSQQAAIDGRCSCPVGHNCKHVAAVLIDYLHKQPSHFPAKTTFVLDNLSSVAALEPAPEDVPSGVSTAVSAWLQRLENLNAAGTAAPQIAPPPEKNKKATVYQLIFVLAPSYNGRHATLSICKARLRANGEIAAAEQVRDVQRLLSSPPVYLQEHDEDLIKYFGAMQGSIYYYEPSVEPRGKIGAQLLRMLLDADKLLWANSSADFGKGLVHPLRAGPQRSAGMAWREGANALHLAWQFQDMPEAHATPAPAADAGADSADDNTLVVADVSRLIDYVLPTAPPWYVDNLSCGELTLLQNGVAADAPGLLALVAQTPALDPGNAITVAHQLVARGLGNVVPMPAKLHETELRDAPVQITLYLGSIAPHKVGKTDAISDFVSGQTESPEYGLVNWHDYATLVFAYDGEVVTIDAGGSHAPPPILRQSVRGIEKIVRDAHAENRALQTLIDCGFAPPAPGAPTQGSLHGALLLPTPAAWLAFAQEVLPQLQQQGWNIQKSQAYRYDVVEVEEWYADVAEGGGNAWFDLELGIVVNQARVSLLPVLIELIRSAPHDFNPQMLLQHADTDQLLATLPDGVRVALPWGRVKPILTTLGELYFTDKTGPGIRLSTLDAARLSELADSTQLRWLGGERLRQMGKKLSEFGGVQKVAPPQGLQATLRDYQSDGLAWMQFLREYELAGILADDMGLGKTVQTLAHILTEKEAGRLTQPALVVAPTSLMSNWREEAARFAPDLRVLTLQGTDRLKHFDTIEQFDLVLTTYALLPRDEDKLREHAYHLVILDESHYIKNARSKAAQTVALLRARHRLCLTGTPLENHLGELWSQFHFLLPGLLGDEKKFTRDFRNPIEKQNNDARRALLIRRVKPFLLRRTKDNVAKELPLKTEMVRSVELSGQQRDLYEAVRLAMDKKVRDEIAKKGVARSQIVILDALLKLRQVCCDPRLVKSDAARKVGAPSAKLIELMEMIEELLQEGRKILVFSQFTSMLALIEAELQARSIRYALLTGDTKDRAGAVRTFQEGHVPLFLISLKAGGIGLNLTAADTVIHYDPWWNPAAENQATDRAWRIGQDKPVFVYKLIAKGTLEEKIQVMQQRKADLARAMLSDGAAQNLKITQEDLQGIFAPLEE